MKKQIKVALGCGWRKYPGFIHIDGSDYRHLDFQANVDDLGFLRDSSVDVIYSSHVLEYFDNIEVVDVLREWRRVLKENGKLYISVPDFYVLCNKYMQDNLLKVFNINGKRNEIKNQNKIEIRDLIGPLFGRMKFNNDTIYHKNTFDKNTLSQLLYNCGFKRIKNYNPEDLIGKVDDHSKAEMNGELISLNVVCIK